MNALREGVARFGCHADNPGHATASALGRLAQWALLCLVIAMSRIPVMWGIYEQRRVIEMHMVLGRVLVVSSALHVVIIRLRAGR